MCTVEHENELLRKLIYQVPCSNRSSVEASGAPPPAEQGIKLDNIKQEGEDWPFIMPEWDVATTQSFCSEGSLASADDVMQSLCTGLMGQNGMTFPKADVIAAIEGVTGLTG